MIETLEGLHQSGALSATELWESLKNIENRTQDLKSVSATTPK